MTTASLSALTWQVYAGNTTDLIAPLLIDLSTFTAASVNPMGAGIGASTNVPADGVVVDNMQGAGDLMVTVGPISTFVPRYQKATLPIPPTTSIVTFQGSNIKPIAYFYTGAFHGEGGSVNAFASQEAANVASITGGTTDAYLDSITWNKNVQLLNGSNLDNLNISGFYDVLNPTNAGTALTAGTWFVECFVYSASNLDIYQRARNALSTDTEVFERRCVTGVWTPWRNVGLLVTGQCQFQYVDATHCRLMPLGGGLLTINGNQEQVPFNANAGLAITNTIGAAALASSTLYFCYAYMSAPGAMALEWSTTAFGLDTRGCPIKAGDGTRTCVGAAYTDANGKFQDTAAFRGVATYFNRFKRTLAAIVPNASSNTTVSVLAVGMYCFSWGTDAIVAIGNGYTYNTVAAGLCYEYVAIGGTNGVEQAQQAPGANYVMPLSPSCIASPPIGLVLIGGYVRVNSNSGFWYFQIEAEVLQ